MTGILTALAVSWILLYLAERKSLSALGVFPVSKRLKQFGAGLLTTAILCSCVQFLESLLKSSEWVLNENIDGNTILNMF